MERVLFFLLQKELKKVVPAFWRTFWRLFERHLGQSAFWSRFLSNLFFTFGPASPLWKTRVGILLFDNFTRLKVFNISKESYESFGLVLSPLKQKICDWTRDGANSKQHRHLAAMLILWPPLILQSIATRLASL